MASVDKIEMRLGEITQSFDASAAAYLERKGWKRVAKASAKSDTDTKKTSKGSK